MSLYSSPQADPGIWFAIHTLAMHADSQPLATKSSYASQMHYLATQLQCKECSTHFQKFLIENPLAAYFRTKGGVFLWSWHFHNSVNARLRKPVLSLEAARKLYSPETAHSCLDCGTDTPARPSPPAKPKAAPTNRFIRKTGRRR